MATIYPFRGTRYNSHKAGDLADLVTPPYDVINEREQQLFYQKNPYNVIRLEYGEIRQPDDDSDNRYTRAAAFFRHWLEEGILARDNSPSVYLYEQEFTLDGTRVTRSGIICGVGVEDYEKGTVLPHEETLSKAKADRLELLRQCRANFSPIFGLFDDPSRTVEKTALPYRMQNPAVSFDDENGDSHRLWQIDRPADLAGITAALADKKIYIADGHHRYETAMAFHEQNMHAGNNSYNFVLMTLVNLHDPGLVILPTHRLVKNIEGFNAEVVTAELQRNFDVTASTMPASGPGAVLQETKQSHSFCLYAGKGKLYTLSISHKKAAELMAARAGMMSDAWRGLDVSVLQCLALEDILGIDRQARLGGANLAYMRSAGQAVDEVDAGVYQAAFLLQATKVSEVLAVAGAGDKMPQKSTYFYPKLITGLVINDFSR